MYKPVHILSRKSIQQQGNVFIWCTGSRSLVGCFEFLISKSSNTFPGWRRVDNNHSPITVPTAYRWITDAVLDQSTAHNWLEAERFTLFPVEVRPSMVLTYSVYKNGSGLSRESQDIIPPDFPVELFLRGGALTKHLPLLYLCPLTIHYSQELVYERFGISENETSTPGEDGVDVLVWFLFI